MIDPALALDVLYADDYLAVVNKPAGLMVHDSALARGESDFAADRLRLQFDKPIFLVHRLGAGQSVDVARSRERLLGDLPGLAGGR